jgi:ATP-dependent Clp protease adaptor protein ClpS
MPEADFGTELIEEIKLEEELREPPMFKVVLNNDDYTPMDFVVMILITIFHRNEADAHSIMMNVHKNGRGDCGVYTYETAETKVKQVELISEKHRYPLKCIMERE